MTTSLESFQHVKFGFPLSHTYACMRVLDQLHSGWKEVTAPQDCCTKRATSNSLIIMYLLIPTACQTSCVSIMHLVMLWAGAQIWEAWRRISSQWMQYPWRSGSSPIRSRLTGCFSFSGIWRKSLLCSLQDKLYQEEYLFVSTEEEREEISKKLSEASNWMEEEGYAAATKVLQLGYQSATVDIEITTWADRSNLIFLV